MMERHFSGLLDRRKYHTDHPEENDVISGYQHIGRIEVIKIFGLIRPAKCGERPQCRREPGIQCVFILFKVCASAFRADLRHFFCNDHFAALVTVICRDTVSPPELSGNTPVTDVLQPVQIDLVKTIRYKIQLVLFQSFDRRFRHLLHLYKPLRFDHRLNGCLTAVVCADAVCMRNNFYQKSQCIQVCYHGFSCLITIHACIFAAQFVNRRIVIHDIDLRQIMSLANLKVVRVVCRCDLYASGSKFFIYVRIRDHRDLTISQRQLQHLADQILVSFIFRVYGNGRISKQCLRTSGRDLHETSFFSDDRVIDMPEESVLIHMFYLCI